MDDLEGKDACSVEGKVVYLSGPMSAFAEADYNKENFDRVKRCCVGRGARLVISPADIACKVAGGVMTQQEAMSYDLRNLLSSEVVVMLLGWQKSAGARVEHDVAELTGKVILSELDVAYDAERIA